MLDLLRNRFDSARAGDLDATIEFDWGDGTCRVGVHQGEATFYEAPEKANAPEPELVIYFANQTQAKQIICGEANPVEAFMAGEFRSNGYIVWVFQTLGAFSKAA